MGKRVGRPLGSPVPLLRGLQLFLAAGLLLAGCRVDLSAPYDAQMAGVPAPTWPVTVACEPWVPAEACAYLRALVEADPVHFSWTEDLAGADLRLGGASLPRAVAAGAWTYAVAAPFRTVEDDVNSAELLSTWRGLPAGVLAEHPLLATPETLRTLGHFWGPPATGATRPVEAGNLLPEAERSDAWALVPFHQLQVGWKVLRVDGVSLLEKVPEGNAPTAYPLQIQLGLGCERRTDALPLLVRGPEMLSNRLEERMTIVAMTGTTALTRSTADVMSRRGLAYPARDIGDWLANADLTHISNEVSFTPDCPIPPNQNTMSFCAHESYIALLEAVGTDVVELTGNHLLDYGPEPLGHTLELFRERGWHWYRGGENLAEALQPLLVTQGPNRLAFVGRNPAGPAHDWATDHSPGSAPCDYTQLQAQVRELRAAGYLPIVTLQYLETYDYAPTRQQVVDLRALAEAGAVVVQGSQAHQPQTMEIRGDTFIHYGLGNLFFDQMQSLGTRQEFVDRLVFYDGRLLSVDLRTALLEEYARPRPMTAAERFQFLAMVFGLTP